MIALDAIISGNDTVRSPRILIFSILTAPGCWMYSISPNTAITLEKTQRRNACSGDQVIHDAGDWTLQVAKNGSKDCVALKIRFCVRPGAPAEVGPQLGIIR